MIRETQDEYLRTRAITLWQINTDRPQPLGNVMTYSSSWSITETTPCPIMWTPIDRPRNLDLVQMQPSKVILLVWCSAQKADTTKRSKKSMKCILIKVFKVLSKAIQLLDVNLLRAPICLCQQFQAFKQILHIVFVTFYFVFQSPHKIQTKMFVIFEFCILTIIDLNIFYCINTMGLGTSSKLIIMPSPYVMIQILHDH